MSSQSTQFPRARKRRFRAGALILSALMLGGVASAGMTVFVSPPAVAIDAFHGAGINWGNGVHQNGAGNYVLPDGRYVYCAEMFIFTDPSSSIPDYVTTGTIPGKSDGGIEVYPTTGDDVTKIGFVIGRYGQTNDNTQAAAVAYAVWALRSGNAGYNAQLAIVANSIGAGPVALAQTYMAEANTWVAAGGGSGFDYTWDPSVITSTSPYVGTVKLPPGTTEMTIEHGTWADGTTTKTWGGSGAPAGTELSWLGTPPSSASWDKYYTVGFSGKRLAFSGQVSFGDGNGWQSSVTAAPPVVRPLNTIYKDPDTVWAPKVESLVTSKFRSVGETLTDTITFGTLPAEVGRTDQWRWRLAEDGVTREWMPVKAKGTVYGPFLSDPALNPSPTPPVGAPVAATVEYTTLNEDGSFLTASPVGVQTPIDTGVAAEEQGYYTFVWEIIGDDQHESVTGVDDCVSPDRVAGCRVFPSNYYFSDGFGTEGETQAFKMTPQFSTLLSTGELGTLGLGQSFTDDISIPAMQNWLRDDEGNRHTMTLTGTAYLVNGIPGSDLVQTPDVPADAVPVSTTKVVTDPAKNGQVLTSESVSMPVTTPREAQFITMHWCVVNADQDPQSVGIWEEKCDDFGVPAESAKIVRPDVTTQAKQLATIYDPITDTAIVNGHVPESSTVKFSLYQQVKAGDAKRDADGNKTDVLWTQEEIDAMGDAAFCVAENKITTTTGIPVDAGTNDGNSYDSPEVFVDENGVYWWIEQLVTIDPETGEEVVLEEGECGLPNETSTVDEPKVTTKATEAVYVGEKAHDTAVVTGPVPGPDSGVKTILTFEAFEKVGNTPVCTVENRVFNLDTPITVAGAGEYRSEDVVFKKAGDYFWSETMKYVLEDGSEVVVHKGECGLPNETTKVKDRPVLALTGATGEPTGLAYGLVIAGLLAALGAAAFFVARRRSQLAVAQAADGIRDCQG